MVGIFFLVLTVGYAYRRKAIIPLSIIIIVGLGIVAIFDISRLNRLLLLGSLIFEKPALSNGMMAPPDYAIVLISTVLAIIGAIVLKTKSNKLLSHQKGLLFACIFCLLFFSFPLLDGEYFKRLSLFLFIPQTLLTLQIASVISANQLKAISVSLFIFTVLSVLAVHGHPKATAIDNIAYVDLKNLNSVIKNDNETIIIARHGLEWWTAWALNIKVGQDKAIDKVFFNKYKNVVFITQVNGFSNDNNRTPFHEPFVPENSELIFSSKYFTAIP